MKTVLFYAAGLDMGGIATAFIALAEELERNGWCVKLMLPYQTDLEKLAVPRRYVVAYARQRPICNRRLISVLNLFHVLTGYVFFFVGVPRVKHDVFVVYNGQPQWVKYSRKPVVGWFHGMAPHVDNRLAGKVWTSLYRGFYNRFSELVAITNQVADSWLSRYSLKKRPTVLPNLVDVGTIIRKSGERQNEIMRGLTPNLIYVGRLAPDKGVSRLVDVAIRLWGEGYKFRLWIVGDGTQRREIEDKVLSANVGSCIKLLGARSNPYPYMRACDMLVLPSFNEGLGLVLWEALLCGAQVMATKCGGTVDALAQGKLGLLVDNSIEGLYVGIKNWLVCPKRKNNACAETIKRNDERTRELLNLMIARLI